MKKRENFQSLESDHNLDCKDPLLEQEQQKFVVQHIDHESKDELTKIRKIEMLKRRKWATYLFAPLLTLCTAFIFGLALYWFQCLRKKFLYKRVKSIREATHVEIDGL